MRLNALPHCAALQKKSKNRAGYIPVILVLAVLYRNDLILPFISKHYNHMKKLTLLLGLCLSLNFLLSQTADPRLKDIDQELEKVLDTWDAPGFAVAVVEKNKVVYAKGFGYRDLEKKIPATANTLYAIGSCSKAFTTSIFGILEGQGKLKFDENPRKYIPELTFNNDEMNNFITIKDLMRHSTGLPRHDFSWYLFPTKSRLELLGRIAHQEPFAGVRESWYYNNFMFLLQGVISEKITGKSWEDNVREMIFKPLGMKTANLSIDELLLAKEAALGYETDEKGQNKKMDYYHIAAMSPAGSINASVNEMAEWLKVWIHGGKYGAVEIIPATFATAAMSPQMVLNGGTPEKDHPDLHFSTYGYGWFASSYKGHYRVQHGGNIDGFSAMTCFFPSDSVGVVVLVNQNGSSVPSVVRNIIADRMLGTEQTDWNTELAGKRNENREKQKEAQTKSSSSKKTGTKPSHLLVEFTGKYANPGYGEFEIVVKNDSLFALFSLKKFWLQHFHYDVFQPFEVTASGIDTSGNSELLFNFTANNVGDISNLNLQVEPALDHPVPFKRTPITIILEKDALEKYVGEYELMGTAAKVYTKGETLYLFVPGQPEYELLATGKHQFSIKILEGFKVEFHEGVGGAVNAVSFIQPNGIFKATRK